MISGSVLLYQFLRATVIQCKNWNGLKQQQKVYPLTVSETGNLKSQSQRDYAFSCFAVHSLDSCSLQQLHLFYYLLSFPPHKTIGALKVGLCSFTMAYFLVLGKHFIDIYGFWYQDFVKDNVQGDQGGDSKIKKFSDFMAHHSSFKMTSLSIAEVP